MFLNDYTLCRDYPVGLSDLPIAHNIRAKVEEFECTFFLRKFIVNSIRERENKSKTLSFSLFLDSFGYGVNGEKFNGRLVSKRSNSSKLNFVFNPSCE